MLALLLITLASAPAGPQDRPCPEGVEVARDTEAFRRLTSPDGPLDVWVAGVVHGDHEVRRSVRLHGCAGAVLQGSGRGTVLRLKGDDLVVEDLRLRGSGSRSTAEDGALKVSGKRAVVR